MSMLYSYIFFFFFCRPVSSMEQPLFLYRLVALFIRRLVWIPLRERRLVVMMFGRGVRRLWRWRVPRSRLKRSSLLSKLVRLMWSGSLYLAYNLVCKIT